jgi:hypothetical protein
VQDEFYEQQIMQILSIVLIIDNEDYIVIAPTEGGRFQDIPRLKAKINFEIL